MISKSKRPLAGYRVVDFGQYIAGPAVAMMLADQGADVVHIDPPGGARWDNPAEAILNRGKRCVTLDLKTEEGVQQAIQLIRQADVVVENFRPGVMNRLGLGAVAMQVINPALVYLSLPGFSAKDESQSAIPAWEGVIAAAVGQFTDMGLNRILMGINPSFSPLPLASAYASVLGATSVNLALFAREKSGRGEVIEVPISAALMEGLAYNSMYVDELPDRYKSPRELEIQRRRRAGEPLNLNYEDLQEFLDPFYRTYECKDGRPFYTVCSSHTRHPIDCLKVLGIWDEIDAAGIPTHSAYQDLKDWPEDADCTIVSYPLSRDWADYVSTKMKVAFKTRTAYEWETLFGEAGVPGSAHRVTREWIHSEHALASGLMLTVDEPKYGPMLQFGNTCWLQGDTSVMDKQCAQPTSVEQVLQGWAEDTREVISVAAEAEPEGWLDGIRILDLTNVIAGPTIAATLARFGAEVISIDPPIPTLDPWNTIVFGMQANQGKTSALLDLKSGSGREVLLRLLPDIDVITINANDGQLQRLGLSYEELREINPEIILCQFDAYSGPKAGPRSDYSGYDDLAQATTGIMSRFGGGIDTPEEHAHFGTIDVLGGYCAAQAVAVALVNRAKGNGGSVARSSLIAAGQLIQVPFMYDYVNREPFNEPSGRQVKGSDPLYRCYQAADGWFFLALNKKTQIEDFKCVLNLPELEISMESDRHPLLEALFITQSRRYWEELFCPLDISCQPLVTMSQLREQNIMDESEANLDGAQSVAFIRFADHPCGYRLELIAPNSVRPLRSKVRVPVVMPKYGAHTVTLLQQLQFSDSEIEQMIEEGAAAIQWSDRYMPT
ncbi:CoA transferase [Amphritea opalescens]|uniref:CoA transferase n=1 Tax=Amphritea opalescens TaxID=2490544 RepID=A0A430KTQ6_9GAMM|nr:CoA transferase [Amphritea opalescens]RTE66703.1 CoA transferase [Amphritea opalescens]